MAKLEHPDLDSVIDVPDSAVPIHMASGWHPVDESTADASTTPPAEPAPSKPRGGSAGKDKE